MLRDIDVNIKHEMNPLRGKSFSKALAYLASHWSSRDEMKGKFHDAPPHLPNKIK